jgi:hypothetical protein
MRKLVLITAAVVALGCTGLAVAHGLDSKSVKAVGFPNVSLTASGTVQTSTCTGSDGTYTRSKGTYTGTISGATGDSNLNGPVTIDATSLVNTTTNVGTVTGHIRFGTTPPPPHGDDKGPGDVHFEAVYSGTGSPNIWGVADGHLRGSHADLLGNISGSFNATGGLTGLQLGGTAAGGPAVETSDGGCKPTPPPAPPKPDRSHAEGVVTALNTNTGAGSITVAGTTCTIPDALLTQVKNLNLTAGSNGSRVEIDCTSGALTKIEAPGHGKIENHGPKH